MAVSLVRSTVDLTNKVSIHRARLLLKWVTTSAKAIISQCVTMPLRPTQPGHPSVVNAVITVRAERFERSVNVLDDRNAMHSSDVLALSKWPGANLGPCKGSNLALCV